MYGLIGKIRTIPGRRGDVAAILGGGTQNMPGCRSYIVAEDPADNDALWVTEVWDSAEAHVASLQIPEVKAAITKGRELIAGFEMSIKTRPIAGA
jgi:quinol monooxygenase YgiN